MSSLKIRVTYLAPSKKYTAPFLGIIPSLIQFDSDEFHLGESLPNYPEHKELLLGQWFTIYTNRFNIGRGFDREAEIENHLLVNHEQISRRHHVTIVKRRTSYLIEILDEDGNIKGKHGTVLNGKELSEDFTVNTMSGFIELGGGYCVLEFKVDDDITPTNPIGPFMARGGLILSLKESQREVCCVGKETKKVPLTPRGYKFLRYLMEHSPDNIPFDGLWKFIHPGEVPASQKSADANLNVIAKEVRDILEQLDEDNDYITNARRHYRFEKKSRL